MKNLGRISQTALSGGLGIVILVGLYLVAHQAGWRLDLTRNKSHSLSPQTVAVLENVRQPLNVFAFYRPGEPDKARTEELLSLYAASCPEFHYEFLDPDRSPLKARELGITQAGEIVLGFGLRKEKILDPDEEKLTNAVIRITDPKKHNVYMVQGHGEAPLSGSDKSVSRLVGVLEKVGITVKPITLASIKKIPDSASGIFIIGPGKNFLDQELKLLTDYYLAGGNVFVAVEAESLTNLDQWILKYSRLERLSGVIVDPVGQIVTGNSLSPVVQKYDFRPVTKDFNLITIFPTATAFVPVGTSDVAGPEPLALTSPDAWEENDLDAIGRGSAEFQNGTDKAGPLMIGAVFSGVPPIGGNAATRLVAFGDQHFLTDQYIGLSGNEDLALNCVNWLLGKENIVAIAKADPGQALLFPRPGQSFFLLWIPLVVVPGITLVLGIVVARRRKKGKRS